MLYALSMPAVLVPVPTVVGTAGATAAALGARRAGSAHSTAADWGGCGAACRAEK